MSAPALLTLMLWGGLMSTPLPQTAPPVQTTPATTQDSFATSGEVGDDYVLGSDDVIEITVANHAGLNERLTILPDGKITLAEAGAFQARGKTAKVLASEIQTALSKTLNNADVTVIVREVHSKRVKIMGAIRQAGGFDMKPNWRIVDLISIAGGLTQKPSRVGGRIVRDDNKLNVIALDVAQAVKEPDSDANIKLLPGDLVILDEPTTRDEVYVIGQVNRPGPYPLDEQSSLLSVISQAGNPVTERAALSKAYVLRNGQQIPLNLRPILAQGKTDAAVTDFTLRSGDVLMIPEIENRYAVMGNVNKPGYYPIPEKGPVNVYEALNLAGGQTQAGDLGKAGIVHSVNGKPTVTKINLNDILRKPELASQTTMQPEDVLFIPPRKGKGVSAQDAFGLLNVFSLFGLRVFR